MTYSDEQDNNCPYQCKAGNTICLCTDETVNCSYRGLTDAPHFSHRVFMKTVLLMGNSLTVRNASFSHLQSAKVLDISRCHITHLPAHSFYLLWRLDSLILEDNHIEILHARTFMGLHNLATLYLNGNQVKTIAPESFFGLDSLKDLNLSHQRITRLVAKSFIGLKSLLKLNLSANHISHIDDGAFEGLDTLLHLDISRNNIQVIGPRVFTKLTKLKRLYTDEFKFCCLAQHVNSCKPAADEFSSCQDLMSNHVLRISIWVIGIIATFGNLHVIGWRVAELYKTSAVGKVHSFLITNLAVADFLMGMYLLIIASVDSYYRGYYSIHDNTWRASSLCQFAGFLSTLSSELSVLTLTTITVDRLISIIFPFQIRRLTFHDARITMACLWLAVAFLAALPLCGIPYFRTYYGRSGVCLPLHITADRPLGWEYSVFIFLGINSVSFIIISISYLSMYSTAKKSRSAVCTPGVRTDNAMAKRMTLIVLTDFVCWIPIITLGVSSLLGADIPRQVYAWIAVFVLPINSAVNPLLYTIATRTFFSNIQHRASSLRKSFNFSANGETRESYACDSMDNSRARELLRMRAMKFTPIRNPSNVPSYSTELSPIRRLRDTDTDSDW